MLRSASDRCPSLAGASTRYCSKVEKRSRVVAELKLGLADVEQDDPIRRQRVRPRKLDERAVVIGIEVKRDAAPKMPIGLVQAGLGLSERGGSR